MLRFLGPALALSWAGVLSAAGHYVEVSYPVSTLPHELQMGVTYTLWIPDGVDRLRGVIVHQHGCGAPACKAGGTSAYDLHWQTLAKKWECALLGPSYHQDEKQDCRLWSDPRNGSEKSFLKALDDLAAKSNHPELTNAPWCLWGHSGGGFWVGVMQALHPERIVAIWFRSGTPINATPKLEIPESAYSIPMMCNPGVKENGDQRFSAAWNGCLAMFKAYRAKGAPIGFAPDPRTSHECGDSRYLAIPFFDASLAMRLPAKGSKDQRLKPVDNGGAWLAALLTDKAAPAKGYTGKAEESVWLPNRRVAEDWQEYVKTGAVGDSTPPSAPFGAKAIRKSDQTVEISWDAEADFESGLKAFVIERDGKEIGQAPEQPTGRFGRPLFQAMSYHDTPERPMPEMRFVDKSAQPGMKYKYRVVAVNSVGLKSKPSRPASLP